ncbi:signal peptidase II [Plantibacter sp. 2H11-2]|uniref:signal peptidase II n=1 Tax=Plantibacter sp. 2H11-2 TaxID=3414431 RepID=UPI003CEC9E64
MTPSEAEPRPSASRKLTSERRRRLTAGALLISLVVVVIDQGSKAWAEASLTGRERIPLVGELLGLQLAYNPGAAFSFGEGFTWVFALVAVAAAVTAIVFAFRVRRPGWAIVIGALGGAAASHAGDRLFRDPGFARGHVVDFIAYGNWFIGNIADIVIVVAVIAGVLLAIRNDRERENNT